MESLVKEAAIREQNKESVTPGEMEIFLGSKYNRLAFTYFYTVL